MTGVFLIILTTLVYTVVHSLLASLEIKAWSLRRFGPAKNRWYRLAYNLFAVISGLPILALLYLLPNQTLYQIPFPWVLLTAIGQFGGVLIIVVGVLQTNPWHFIGLRQIIKPESTPPSMMVTNGLYRWVRHPLYTGGLLLIWLVPTMTVNLLTTFILLTIYLLVGAKLEEKRLLHEYGDRYQEYQARVPMLLPFPHRRGNLTFFIIISWYNPSPESILV